MDMQKQIVEVSRYMFIHVNESKDTRREKKSYTYVPHISVDLDTRRAKTSEYMFMTLANVQRIG